MKYLKIYTLLALLLMAGGIHLQAQLRIDWQQTYGGQLPNCDDEAWGIAPTDDGYLVAGVGRSPISGMVTCDFGQQATGNWLLKIGYHGELLWQTCYPAIYPLDLDRSIANKNVYYSIGEGRYPTTGKASLCMAKYDSEGELLWSRNLGNENYSFPYEKYGCATTDGGVIGGAQLTFSEGGDIGLYYGQSDGWITKLDSLGQVEWEISIGTTGTEFIHHLSNAADGGYYAFLSGYTIGDGSIEACDIHVGLYTNDNILVKLSHQGEVEWTRCYGGSNSENSYCLMELGNGLILAGNSDSEDGLIYPTGDLGRKIWMFRTDANGNLLWERAIGHTMCSRIGIGDVLKESDREYVIAATSETMLGEHNGDYYCTNDTLFDGHTMNYWVLHVTDTVDYTTYQVPEWQQPQERTSQVYPNPTNNTVRIVLPEDALVDEVQLYNALGQLVKTVRGTNEINVAGLVEGVYLLRITDAEGRSHAARLVVKE